jgi:hypothetical protein
MKNLRLKAAALVLFVTAGLASCSSDDAPTIVTKKTFVTEVTGPTTAKLNEEIALEVTYAVENNCGVFNKFVETSAENTKTIEVETKVEGTTCDSTPATKKTTYKFKAATEGTFILNFKKSETEFVTQTIIVSTAS